MTEGGWDRLRDRARTLSERDGKNKPLVQGNNNDDVEYDEDGDIPNDENEYTVGLTVSTSSLTRVTTSMKLSALPPCERSLRVSGRACPHA